MESSILSTDAAQPRVLPTLRSHWPEYLIEAWALGMFMISACVFTIWFEHPDSLLRNAIPSADMRRALIGAAMGLTAITLIYSPWGKRSGAQMNPAITLAFFRLGKTSGIDAAFYMLSQFLGGSLGVLLVAFVFGNRIANPAVNYAVTVPQPHQVALAFVSEFVISFLMLSMVLRASSSARLQKYTGIFAGLLVAVFITFEAPLSGMSMNPARSFASALPANSWSGFWVYIVAPVIAMQAAAAVYVALRGKAKVACAKFQHPTNQRCIHCGHKPPFEPPCEPSRPRSSL